MPSFFTFKCPADELYILSQEPLFNGVASALYIGASAYLLVTVQTILWPLYIVTPFFQTYPALTAAYVSSFQIIIFD